MSIRLCSSAFAARRAGLTSYPHSLRHLSHSQARLVSQPPSSDPSSPSPPPQPPSDDPSSDRPRPSPSLDPLSQLAPSSSTTTQTRTTTLPVGYEWVDPLSTTSKPQPKHISEASEALGLQIPPRGPTEPTFFPPMDQMDYNPPRLMILLGGLLAFSVVGLLWPFGEGPEAPHQWNAETGAFNIQDKMKFTAREELVKERRVAPFVSPEDSMHHRMSSFLTSLESTLLTEITTLERSLTPRHLLGLLPSSTPNFTTDTHPRPNSGGSTRSSVLHSGHVFEKATINTTVATGRLPPRVVLQMRAGVDSKEMLDEVEKGEEMPYAACGMTVVLHPREPGVPSVQMNLRYFEAYEPDRVDKGPVAGWFGGSTDLSPSYLSPSDATHFHTSLAGLCASHHPAYYPLFKEQADNYFFLPHRKEARGVGGIYFDDLDKNHFLHRRRETGTGEGGEKDQEDVFRFVRDLGEGWMGAYEPLVREGMARAKRENGKGKKSAEEKERERRWQALRRGRWVEFELVNHERGTKMGLQTPNARVESVLMSLPQTAGWEYMSDLGSDPSSAEGQLLAVLKNPRDWVERSSSPPGSSYAA